MLYPGWAVSPLMGVTGSHGKRESATICSDKERWQQEGTGEDWSVCICMSMALGWLNYYLLLVVAAILRRPISCLCEGVFVGV